MQQKELMAQIEVEANTSKGRGKRGGRATRARGRTGRGRIFNSSQGSVIDSAFLNVLFIKGFVPVQGNDVKEEVEDTEEMIVQRKKKSTANIAQVDITNANMSLVADTM